MAGSADLGSLISLESGRSRPQRCTTCRLLGELQGEDLKALRAALADPQISAPMIARALNKYGVKISPSAISRHLRECDPVD